jgi:hypothetical protein
MIIDAELKPDGLSLAERSGESGGGGGGGAHVLSKSRANFHVLGARVRDIRFVTLATFWTRFVALAKFWASFVNKRLVEYFRVE